MRILDEIQLSAFDATTRENTRRVGLRFLPAIAIQVEDVLGPNSQALDVGGSTGAIADWFLDRYPNRWTVLDLSEHLLSKNAPHPRKTVMVGDALNLARRLPQSSYDLVLMHRLLHHLVGDTYRGSIENIRSALSGVHHILRPDGYLSIIDTPYDGFLGDSLASCLLYYGTRSRLLAGITRRLGANTAGTGICYLSAAQWTAMFESTAFSVVNQDRIGGVHPSWVIHLLTCMKRMYSRHWLLKPIKT